MKIKNMRRARWELTIAMTLFFALCYAAACDTAQQELADDLLRLRVVAHSDTEEDQAVKLCVRDRVLEIMQPLEQQADSRADMQQLLREHMQEIANAAQQEVYANGHTERITACLAEEWYPTRDYAAFSLPAGEYEGLQIRIGQAEGRIARALGMRVLAYDLYPSDSGRAIGEYVDLDALYRQSDVISLHCNLTPENTRMINKDSIAKMKDGVILINNARGQLIDEQDVADALNSGKLAAAGLDVVYTEPIREDNPLLKAKNCIITPHISWAPKESRQRIMDGTAENIRAFLAGRPQNVVNP